MVFLGAVFGVCVESGAGSFGGVSALVTGSGKWLLDPTTQPTIPRMMTTALMATIRNLFMVLPHLLWNAFGAKTCKRFVCNGLESRIPEPCCYWTPGWKRRVPVGENRPRNFSRPQPAKDPS